MRSAKKKIFPAALALMLALVACGPLQTNRSPALLGTPVVEPAATPASLTEIPVLAQVGSPTVKVIKMITTGIGWAVTDTDVLRTANGGKTWFKTNLDGITSDGLNGFFLDEANAWILAPSGDQTSGSLHHTTDGGVTWTSAQVPFGGGSLYFTDESSGWVMVGLGAGMSHMAVAIFRTSDGGSTWTQVFTDDPNALNANNSLPFVGDKTGLTALDGERAWVSGAEPVSDFIYIYMTEDGGEHWVGQEPPMPNGFAGAMTYAFPPVFFSSSEAVMPVGVYSQNSATVIYVSHDGGQTWLPSQPAPASGQVSTPSEQVFFVWDGGGYLHRSRDGGGSWESVSTNVDFSSELASFQFVDAKRKAGPLPSMPPGAIRLYESVDGGATWTMLIP